ncbi:MULTISPECIES: hypothetical protein [unclassified Mycobacterium]|uniref:hypothetical protein n=1 Tax=unclassified Mycobacterium TaxID=2642494 RepID=UPI0007FF5889|nr:hypothetical protein A5704_15165 [Mycobacterium sp. E735]OBG65033.1 hypothetical protein A5703_16625 [Mycobacterium sp. E188]OBG72134.1 hypothetical protein A5701_00165 [Mycobacterium sp. E3305]OBG80076.1 hypothetical protein A9X05_21200 [Mycobacterium sp. E3298]OBH26896.1 hypothetical protein A9X03_11865 [Mycobacterium sp. E1715]OBH38950.1 hypothetical protein A5691_23280 [Mycobacterium sp. E183]
MVRGVVHRSSARRATPQGNRSGDLPAACASGNPDDVAARARLEANIVVGQHLERASNLTAADVGKWLPSLLPHRPERPELACE